MRVDIYHFSFIKFEKFFYTLESIELNDYFTNFDIFCLSFRLLQLVFFQSDFPMGDLPMLTLNTSDRVWDLSYRNISQMRMTTRRNKKDATNGAIDDLFL